MSHATMIFTLFADDADDFAITPLRWLLSFYAAAQAAAQRAGHARIDDARSALMRAYESRRL